MNREVLSWNSAGLSCCDLEQDTSTPHNTQEAMAPSGHHC